MPKGYSVVKRGNVYFIYHRKNLEGRLVGRSLKTSELRDAHRKAKVMVAELDRELAIAQIRKEETGTASAEHERFMALSEEEQMAELGAFLNNASNALATHQRKKLEAARREREAEEAEQRRIAEQRILDETNPRADQFWWLAEKKENDTGLYVDWCRAGNRSANTLIAYRTAWRRFRQYFNVERLGDITPRMAKDFEKKLLKSPRQRDASKPLSMAGAKQYIICMQGMISTAIKEGWFEGVNPFQVDYQHKRDRVVDYLKPKQVDALLKEADKLEDKTVYLFIAIAVHTGMRKDEIANLMWTDIDFDNKVVKVQAKDADDNGVQAFRPKSKQARSIPLKQELANILEPFRQDTGYVLLPGSQAKRTRWNMPKDFKTVQEAAGVKCNPHLFRHTFASWAAIKGVSIYKIQTWLGHSTVQLTADTYAHLQAHDEDIDRF